MLCTVGICQLIFKPPGQRSTVEDGESHCSVLRYLTRKRERNLLLLGVYGLLLAPYLQAKLFFFS